MPFRSLCAREIDAVVGAYSYEEASNIVGGYLIDPNTQWGGAQDYEWVEWYAEQADWDGGLGGGWAIWSRLVNVGPPGEVIPITEYGLYLVEGYGK